jgi:hypothetical protein
MMPPTPVSCKPPAPGICPRVTKKSNEIKGLPQHTKQGVRAAARKPVEGQADFHKVSLFIAAQGCN